MSAELLLQNFDLIGEAPDAIERLRRFVLNLAVRGKLVDQDLHDEPAAELLKRIHAEKARLVKEGKAKMLSLSPMDESEQPFVLPENWAWTRLGEIGDWGSGSTPPRSNNEYYGDDVIWLKSGELGDCLGVDSSEERLTHLALRKCSFRVNQPGDVLIAMYGATIGKLAILSTRAVTNQAVCGCTPIAGIFNKYLFFYLLSRREDFQAQSEGGAQPNISKVKIVSSPFALPPTEEQRRIVAKVEELMALCDQLEAAKVGREQTRDQLVQASLQRLNQLDHEEIGHKRAGFVLDNFSLFTTRAEHIKKLRETIRNLAVRGKLVSQNTSDGTAAELLQNIQLMKTLLMKDGLIPRSKVRTGMPKFAFELPPNWEAIHLDDVCNLVTSGSRGWAEHYSKSGPKFVRAQNIRFGRLRLDDLACVNPPAKGEGRRTKISEGDLLVVITGAGVTNPALMDRDLGEAYVSQHVALIKPTATALSRWLLLCLMAGMGGRDELVERAYGAGKPGLNLDNIRTLRLPLPPLAEQERVLAKVDELMTLFDELEVQLATTATDSGRLLEAVLHEAFAKTKLAEAA